MTLVNSKKNREKNVLIENEYKSQIEIGEKKSQKKYQKSGKKTRQITLPYQATKF